MTRFWIEDRNNPSKLDWTLDRAEQQKGVYKDYALVARFLDPNTDRVVTVAAGIARGLDRTCEGQHGTPSRHDDQHRSLPGRYD
jgi:hypothetical protein